ncbi:MAG: RluA family pseudouridine synthase [Spirochaetia bacterium]
MAPRFVSITLGLNDDGRRIDRVARKAFPQLPLSRIYSALRSGEIRLNGKRIKGDVRVAAGDRLDTHEQLLRGAPASREQSGTHERSINELDGRIVYESPHLLVVAKRRGELVHGPDSLATLVQTYLAHSVAPGISFTPGPVHRLDRNTTGLVMYGASLRGAQEMSTALRAHRVQKIYAAVLTGVVTGGQRWDARLTRDHRTHRSDAAHRGQTAVTLVNPVGSGRNASLVVARIITGRTHQIRAHASINGTPLLGDRKYGGLPIAGGYILHAGALTVAEPTEAIGFAHLWTPLPTSAETRVRNLFGDAALSALYETLAIPSGE